MPRVTWPGELRPDKVSVGMKAGSMHHEMTAEQSTATLAHSGPTDPTPAPGDSVGEVTSANEGGAAATSLTKAGLNDPVSRHLRRRSHGSS